MNETTVPEQMRAAVLTEHGGPEAVEVRTVATPEPRPGEVLVRVGAAGCNNTDLWTREGAYGHPGPSSGWAGPIDFPRIQGGDVAGTVVAVGSEVPEDLVGARVLADPARYEGPGSDALVTDVLGSERDGGFAEYVLLGADDVHRVDGSPLTDVQLAALPIAYGTALGILIRGGVAEGQRVLVTGASGGVGLAAVQLAVARGARVVAVSSGDKTGAVAEAGAAVVIDRERGAVIDDAREAAGEGYHLVVDLVAGSVLAAGLDLLVAGGRWVVAGALGGAEVPLDVRRLYLRNRMLLGSTMHTPGIFAELVDIARRGEVAPVVAATFGLEDVHRAHDELAARTHVGKLVVVPGHEATPGPS